MFSGRTVLYRSMKSVSLLADVAYILKKGPTDGTEMLTVSKNVFVPLVKGLLRCTCLRTKNTTDYN